MNINPDSQLNDVPLIRPHLTRKGLNALIRNKGNAAQALTHISLSPTPFQASSEITSIPDEIYRWDVLDGYESTETQITAYAEFPWNGDDVEVRSMGFYIGDELLAVYSNNNYDEIEAYLTKRVLLNSWYHLAFDAAPAGSITVVNTGKQVNPDFVQLNKAFYDMALVQRRDLELRISTLCEED